MILSIQKTVNILLILTLLSTAALGARQQAQAADSVKIINSVQSSTHTGGQNSSGGAAGQSGAAGADGTAGVSGADGADGAVGAGRNSVSTYVHSTIGSESYVERVASSTDNNGLAEYTELIIIESKGVESDESAQARLIKTLQSLQLILLKYVSTLL